MKIQTDGLAGASGIETARAQEAAAAAQGGKSHGTAAPATAGDSVQLSSLSARVQAAASTEETGMSARASEIAALYAKGQYQVDAGKLSHALVSSALGGKLEGGGQ